MKILGCDLARIGSDSTSISLYNVSVPKELRIGEEYFLPQYQRSQMGLRDEDRLVVVEINENRVHLLITKQDDER